MDRMTEQEIEGMTSSERLAHVNMLRGKMQEDEDSVTDEDIQNALDLLRIERGMRQTPAKAKKEVVKAFELDDFTKTQEKKEG